jgi:hypothetical protein
LLLLLSIGIAVSAQDNVQWGTLPSVNANIGLENDWKANLKWESRQVFDEDAFSYGLSDFSLLFARKVGLNNSLAGGYLIRVHPEYTAHRSIQQFTIVQTLPSIRLAHRLASDQTFRSGRAPQWRLRYRIATELPLNGQEVDPREAYFKINHEYLNVFQTDRYDLEVRLVPTIGYAFTDNNKLEVGCDIRTDGFLSGTPDHTVWFGVSWYRKW